MGIVVKEGSTWESPPADIHVGVCVDIVDLGLIESEYNGEKLVRDMCRLVWELDPSTAGLTSKDERFTISRRYTKSLHERSNLRHDLESWRGRAFTSDELKGFDLDNILDKPARLVVEKIERDGKERTNVTKVLTAPKGCGFIQSGEYVRICDRPQSNTTPTGNGGGYGSGGIDVPLGEEDSIPF